MTERTCNREQANHSSASRASRFRKAGVALWATPLLPLTLAVLGVVLAPIHTHAKKGSEPLDKYAWLEDVHGKRALAWVNAENERSAKVLESDPHFGALNKTELKLMESPERLPVPSLNGNEVYNTWQDAQHVKGILRRTSLGDYLAAKPHWQTVLDFDALSKQDNESWVDQGLSCLFPGDELCLIALSAGGEDAVNLREFNLKTSQFVQGGFVLPKSKQVAAWVDKDTLLVARDWGPGSMTKSGYPFVAKLWKRGQRLDQAKEVFRGAQTDEAGVDPMTLNDAEGHRVALVSRGLTFFERVVSLVTPEGTKPTALPAKADVNGLVDGQMIVTLNDRWTPKGQAKTFVQGSVISLDLPALQKDPLHLKPTVVFAPTAREFAQQVQLTKNRLLLTTLENVQGRVYVYSHGTDAHWTGKKLNVPANLTVDVASTNWSDDQFFLSLSGFLTPSSLWLGNASDGTLNESKTLPPQFDSSQDTVEQSEATSPDGTKVPYFIVRPKNMQYDGTNPTVLTAYGGFQISMTPYYSVSTGKLWLERGGVYVVANIRGGGEFGPAWHDAGLKTHRQRIYDDFAAVGRDLITRRVTSPGHLGIVGASNGGLLMGVELTQHPEMWNAVVIQIPLLDMLNFEHLAAGASWVAEYGSVKTPQERAFLASISPYNQLRPDVKYPEPLLFTTTKDDRVGPVHARKFAAKMEEFNKPFFYEEIVEGGHGNGADLKERAKSTALEFTYFIRKLMY